MVSPYLNNARGLVDTKNVGCEYHGLFCLGQAKFKIYPKISSCIEMGKDLQSHIGWDSGSS